MASRTEGAANKAGTITGRARALIEAHPERFPSPQHGAADLDDRILTFVRQMRQEREVLAKALGGSETFGALLAKGRAAVGRTVEELAQRSELPEESIIGLEAEQLPPWTLPVEKVVVVAAACGLTVRLMIDAVKRTNPEQFKYSAPARTAARATRVDTQLAASMDRTYRRAVLHRSSEHKQALLTGLEEYLA